MDWVGGAATGSVWGWAASGLLRRRRGDGGRPPMLPLRRWASIATLLLTVTAAVAVSAWVAGAHSGRVAAATLLVGGAAERCWHRWLHRPSHPLNRGRAA